MKKLFICLCVSVLAVFVIAQSYSPITVVAPTFRHTNGPAAIGQVLTATSTAGAMAWSNAPAGGSGSPVGPTNSLQYNSGGLFAGSAGMQVRPSNSIDGVLSDMLVMSTGGPDNGNATYFDAFGVGARSLGSFKIGTSNSTPRWEFILNGNFVPSVSNNQNIGTLLKPIGTNFGMSYQMHPNARNNRTLRSDANGFGSWSPNPAGGNGNTDGAAFAPLGAIQFAATNDLGNGMMLDSTNAFRYLRGVNEMQVTNEVSASNTVIGAGYVKTRLLEVSNLNVNTLVVTNGIPAFGANGDVQYANDGLLDSEAAFNYNAGSNSLAVGMIHTSLPGSRIVGVTNGGNATVGDIGEHVRVLISARPAGATDTYTILTNISLTPGDWLVTVNGLLDRNSATMSAVAWQLGITDNAVADGSGLVLGDNFATFTLGAANLTFTYLSTSVPSWRFNTPTNVVLSLKSYVGSYTVATPQINGRLSAVRIR